MHCNDFRNNRCIGQCALKMPRKYAALSVLALNSELQTQGYVNWPVSSRPAQRWPPPSCAPGPRTDRCCLWATRPRGWSGSLCWCIWGVRRVRESSAEHRNSIHRASVWCVSAHRVLITMQAMPSSCSRALDTERRLRYRSTQPMVTCSTWLEKSFMVVTSTSQSTRIYLPKYRSDEKSKGYKDLFNKSDLIRAVAITAISQYRAIDVHNRRGMQQPRYFLFFFRKVTPFSFYTLCICTEY